MLFNCDFKYFVDPKYNWATLIFKFAKKSIDFFIEAYNIFIKECNGSVFAVKKINDNVYKIVFEILF